MMYLRLCYGDEIRCGTFVFFCYTDKTKFGKEVDDELHQLASTFDEMFDRLEMRSGKYEEVWDDF